MNESISKSIERGMVLSLSGSTPVTEMSKYVLENALGRKVTMDGYATPAQVLRHLEEVKDEAAAKAAASKAEHQQRHFEFSQALDSVGLGTIFHPEELRFDNPEVSLHRGPNDDTLTHRYHEGTHQVALARRTGDGNRIGYGSHQNPRDALMMAIKDFNGKRAKGVNEDYEFDKSGKYITEASKSPNAVRMTSSVRQHLGGGMIAQTRNGKYYLLDPHATNGKLPRPGEEIDPSKHHYIGDGEWTPKHAEAVERINAARGKVPAIKAVDEAESLDELSKEVLLRYIHKSLPDAVGRSHMAGRDAAEGNRSATLASYAGMDKARSRMSGVETAAKKLARKPADEQIESRVNEADHSDFVKALKDSGMDSHFRDSNIQSLTNPSAHDFYGKSGELLSHERDPQTGNHAVMLSKKTPGGIRRAFGSGADAASALRDVMRKYSDSMVESESLNELSKDTLLRYIRKSMRDAGNREVKAGRAYERFANNSSDSDSRKEFRAHELKSVMRQNGIALAARKLARRSVNEAASLDELSKDTLASYIHRASIDAANASYVAGRDAQFGGDDHGASARRGIARSIKRTMGINKAADKLAATPKLAPIEMLHRTNEAAPPDMEDWVKANKARFIKEYGDKKGHEVLYATAWKLHDKKVDESEQDNIDHVKRMKAYHAAVKATDDASMAKVHFRMRHDISQPDHREAYNQLKRKHREARRAEAAAAEHVKGVLFAKHVLGENELNELSPATIRSYLTKAIRDYGASRDTMGYMAGEGKGGPLKDKTARNAKKRMVGIQRAIDNFGDDTQRNVKLPAGFGEGVDPGEVSPLFSNK